eukprot:gene10319-biopygen4981
MKNSPNSGSPTPSQTLELEIPVLNPKKTEPHPTAIDLRPLTLFDCRRKVWGKIILHRINKKWHNHGTLSTLSNTDSEAKALPVFSSTGPPQQKPSKHLHIFRKAFDSVSKPIIKLAWFRFGVPTDVVEWIVALDQEPHLTHLIHLIHLTPTPKPTGTPIIKTSL